MAGSSPGPHGEKSGRLFPRFTAQNRPGEDRLRSAVKGQPVISPLLCSTPGSISTCETHISPDPLAQEARKPLHIEIQVIRVPCPVLYNGKRGREYQYQPE